MKYIYILIFGIGMILGACYQEEIFFDNVDPNVVILEATEYSELTDAPKILSDIETGESIIECDSIMEYIYNSIGENSGSLLNDQVLITLYNSNDDDINASLNSIQLVIDEIDTIGLIPSFNLIMDSIDGFGYLKMNEQIESGDSCNYIASVICGEGFFPAGSNCIRNDLSFSYYRSTGIFLTECQCNLLGTDSLITIVQN